MQEFKRIRNILKEFINSKRFQKISKESKRIQGIQRIPKDSKRIQKISKESKRFLKIPLTWKQQAAGT